MLVIPVMYIRGGSVLKPSGGTPTKSDPLELARDWVNAGVELIHIVDLDTPATGASPNIESIKKIHTELKIPFEIEANIHAIDTAEKYMGIGAECLALGSIAYQKPAILAELCKKFPQKIATNLDVRRGKVVIKGWAVTPNKSAQDYAMQFREAGVTTIFYSDSEEEGIFKASDVGNIREFVKRAGVVTIQTTDLSSIHDMEELITLELYGLKGTLLGKSIYEGHIDLKGAVTFAKDKSRGMDEPTYTAG